MIFTVICFFFRDWCISRQLWWGHQIPAYSCSDQANPTNQVWVAAQSENEARLKAAQKLNVAESNLTIVRDEDVLDTWFSSSLQPFASVGWPEQVNEWVFSCLCVKNIDIYQMFHLKFILRCLEKEAIICKLSRGVLIHQLYTRVVYLII